MKRRREKSGIILLGFLFLAAFSGLGWYYSVVCFDTKLAEAAADEKFITLSIEKSGGNIYDRNMQKLVNKERKFTAIAVPQAIDYDQLIEYAADINDFTEKYNLGEPFEFLCKKKPEESEGLTVFETFERYSEDQTAQHIIGYVSENTGVSGIEYAYDKILRSSELENSVTYSIDGFGRVLIGEGKEVVRSGDAKSGVILTIDREIQEICEKAGSQINKGTIIVSDVENGDILGMASFPQYKVSDLEDALKDERSPLINRALYSYSVGSIFKLVTACEAINEGYDSFVYDCEGTVDVLGQSFNCHKHEGHGIQNITEAMVNSCNTYYISLSRLFDIKKLYSTASSLGFGKECQLCSDIVASGGVLPSVNDLMIPAELANFSFGQGKLTASPIQITRLTCAIANGGNLPEMRLVKGIMYGEEVSPEKSTGLSRAMSSETAKQLRDMMFAAVYRNKDSNARPLRTSAGVKTSTAQTGQFDKDGNEKYNAWITGFFPAFSPQYAVTVLVEDGGYGNDSAAPIFKEIADEIINLKENH